MTMKYAGDIFLVMLLMLMAVSPFSKVGVLKSLHMQDAFLALTIFTGLVVVAARGGWQFALRRIPLAAIGAAAVALVSVSGAANLPEAQKEALKIVLMLLLFVTVFLVACSGLSFPMVTGGMTLACLAILSVGLWQLTHRWPYPFGPFSDRNILAGVAAGLIVIGTGWFERVGRRLKHVLAFFFVLFGLFLLPVSAWVSIGAGFVFMLAFRATRPMGVTGLLAGLAWLVLATVFFGDYAWRQIGNLAIHDPNGTDISQRYLEWWAALNMMSDNLVFGVGAGNYQTFIGKYYSLLPKLDLMEWSAQNGWLVTGSTMGLAGLCMFAWLFTGALKPALRELREGGDSSEGILAAAVVTWMVANMFTVIFVRETMPFVMIALALLWSFASRNPTNADVGGKQQSGGNSELGGKLSGHSLPAEPSDRGRVRLSRRGVVVLVVAGLVLGLVLQARLTVRNPFYTDFEAESMENVVSPMAVMDDRLASGFKALEIPYGSGRGIWKEAGGSAEKTISVPRGGNYYFWVRVRWEGGCENAIYLQVDKGRNIVVGNDAIFDTWHWVRTGPFNLAAGGHRLKFSNHSHGIRMDKVEIVNDPQYEPSGYGKEVLAFFDGFGGCDGQDYGSWTFLGGKWSIVGSSAGNQRATSATLVQTFSGESMAVAHQVKWKDCDYEAYMMSAGQGPVGIVFSYHDRKNYNLLEWENGKRKSQDAVSLYTVRNGERNLIGKGGRGYRNDAWQVLGVRCNNGKVVVRTDDEKVFEAAGVSVPGGLIGLSSRDNNCVYFDNVKVVKLIDGKPADDAGVTAAVETAKDEEDIEGHKFVVERIKFGKTAIPAFLIYQKARIGNFGPAVIEMHGFGESKNLKARRLQPRPALRGYVEMHFDLKGHGERTETDFEERCRDNFPKVAMDILKTAAGDVIAAMHYLENRKDLGVTKVGITGYSMGGAAAMVSMRLDKRIAAGASVNSQVCGFGDESTNTVSYSALRGWKTDTARQVDAMLRADHAKFDPVLHLDDFEHRPVFLMCGRNDRIAGCDSAILLAGKLRQNYGADSNRVELIVVDGPVEKDPMASHMPDIMKLKLVDEFLDRNLK